MPAMKPIFGLLWALGGGVAGFVLGAALAGIVAHLTNQSNREGAIGYLMMACGIIGALVGLGLGLWWFARSAPAGQGLQQLVQGVLGVLGLIALVALGLWAWVQSREVPVTYDGDTQASLLLEFRLRADAAPTDIASRWLNVEVTTANTRPEALVLTDKVRREGEYVIVPAVQGPLIRSGNRLIVARFGRGDSRHDEVFMPPIPRKPDPRADWSEWTKPREVFDPKTDKRGNAVLEMRWRLELYGQ